MALFHLPITLFSFTSTSNVRNHLKNKLLFFQRVLVGIQCMRVKARGCYLQECHPPLLKQGFFLAWSLPINRDSQVSSAPVLRSQAQGTMADIFTWMLWMEIRIFGSTLPSLSPDKCLWKHSKYLGTADKPTPCSEKVMLAEGLHWHSHVILPCSFPKESLESQFPASAPGT